MMPNIPYVCKTNKKSPNILDFFKLGGGKKGRSKATDTEDISFLLSGVEER